MKKHIPLIAQAEKRVYEGFFGIIAVLFVAFNILLFRRSIFKKKK